MAKLQRIWELDALRGICILAMVLLHALFDLQYFIGIDALHSGLLRFLMQYGGILFVLLSGLCATLGSHSLRRGAQVFGCAMVVTLVTWAMSALGLAGPDIVVKFGVLHLLGIAMLLWPLAKKLPTWALAVLGVTVVVLGYWFRTFTVETVWLFPLGLKSPGFMSSDYFPLFPQLGWFWLGAVLGRTVYREKRTLLPKAPADRGILRFFCRCGTHSLWIYLLHQPILYGLVELLQAL